MAARHSEFEEIRHILEEADEPLTASEILEDLEDHEIDSAHRVATVLGRRADSGDVDVIRDRPYRYRV
ncbi:hypothetical protein [Salinarchaeum laminariae]|uniref:hypothetical protein n=1 Tax=Salinarchaeum laminariae TaxID=869888 RepID=UPI0020BEAB28|nr:hypothetical protein [Salinarchaeum laminariae]